MHQLAMSDREILWTIAILLVIANLIVWVMVDRREQLQMSAAVELFCCECWDESWHIGMRWEDGHEKILSPRFQSEAQATAILTLLGEWLQGQWRQSCH